MYAHRDIAGLSQTAESILEHVSITMEWFGHATGYWSMVGQRKYKGGGLTSHLPDLRPFALQGGFFQLHQRQPVLEELGRCFR